MPLPLPRPSLQLSAAFALFFLLTGCAASYVVPGGAAEMAMFVDDPYRPAHQRKPESPLPARLATVRVQASGYVSRHARGQGSGNYSIVTVREVEKDEDFKNILALPQIAGITPLNRLMIGNSQLKSDVEIRRAAAALGADMVLLYTFDTNFHVDDGMRPLSVVTLGLFPTKVATVTTTASSLLIDVRSGYIYATGEATAQRKPLANAWTDDDAVDVSRQQTEREAFVNLVKDFERLWPQVVRERQVSMGQAR